MHPVIFSLLLTLIVVGAAKSLPIDSECMQNEAFHCNDDLDTCISSDLVCNGITECPNDYDEVNCNERLPSQEEYQLIDYRFCKPDEFKCHDGTCIKKSLLCNNIPDCSGAEDEGELCGGCEDLGCDYKCQETPHGPECDCPMVMFLSIDRRTCEFEDACAMGEGRKCVQHCVQNEDRVTCSCSPGYTLKEKFECELNEEYRNGSLLFIENGKIIRSLDLFNDSSAVYADLVVSSTSDNLGAKEITSLTFNQRAQTLYYVARESGSRQSRIYQSDAQVNTPLLYGYGIKTLAYDWIADNLYYTADGLGIGVCSGDGRFCSHLIPVAQEPHFHYYQYGDHQPLMQTYGELIVHPRRGILLWLDYNAEHPNGVIMSAGMDGRNPRSIGGMNTHRLQSFALDYVRDVLYVVEGSALSSLNLHTLQRHVLSHGISPYTMAFFNSHLFYVSRGDRTLVKRKVPGGLSSIALHPLHGSHFSMAINNSLYYERISNPCANASCSHLCVLSESSSSPAALGASCICPDKYIKGIGGECVFNPKVDGVVKLSSSRMKELCDSDSACNNGGKCKAVSGEYPSNATPSCDCPHHYSGLYCELQEKSVAKLQSDDSKGSGNGKAGLSLLCFVLVFGFIFALLLYLVNRKYPRFLPHILSKLSACLSPPKWDKEESRGILKRGAPIDSY